MGFGLKLTLFLLRMGFEKSPERIRSTLIRPSLPKKPLCFFFILTDLPKAAPLTGKDTGRPHSFLRIYSCHTLIVYLHA
jgi:hypothetical protein